MSLDQNKLHEQASKGANAFAELALTGAAFAGLRSALIDAWSNSDPRDTTGREKLWVATTQLTHVENALRSHVTNGKIAVKELEAIRKAGEPRKRFGII